MSGLQATIRPRQDTVRVYVGYLPDFANEARLILDKFNDVEGFATALFYPDAHVVTNRREKVLLIPTTTGTVPEEWVPVLARFSPMQLQYVLVVPDSCTPQPWSVRLGDSTKTYTSVIRRRVLANGL